MAQEIILSRGLMAIVDDEDYAELSKNKWCVDSDNYAVRTIRVNRKQTTERMHRVIMRAPDHLEVDHINGNGLDNRKDNLRLCTSVENARNRTRMNPNNSSGFRGVCFNKFARKWQAQIRINGKYKQLGTFSDIKEAVKAYDIAARNYYGEFAPSVGRF